MSLINLNTGSLRRRLTNAMSPWLKNEIVTPLLSIWTFSGLPRELNLLSWIMARYYGVGSLLLAQKQQQLQKGSNVDQLNMRFLKDNQNIDKFKILQVKSLNKRNSNKNNSVLENYRLNSSAGTLCTVEKPKGFTIEMQHLHIFHRFYTDRTGFDLMKHIEVIPLLKSDANRRSKKKKNKLQKELNARYNKKNINITFSSRGYIITIPSHESPSGYRTRSVTFKFNPPRHSKHQKLIFLKVAQLLFSAMDPDVAVNFLKKHLFQRAAFQYTAGLSQSVDLKDTINSLTQNLDQFVIPTPSTPLVVIGNINRNSQRSPVPTHPLAEKTIPPQAPKNKHDSDLPIFNYYVPLLKSIQSSQVTIVSAETGAGKSTQIPQFIVSHAEMFGLSSPSVLVTQPRRVAAVSVANRVSQESNGKLNVSVGYHVRHDLSAPNLGRNSAKIGIIPFPFLSFYFSFLILNPRLNTPIINSFKN